MSTLTLSGWSGSDGRTITLTTSEVNVDTTNNRSQVSWTLTVAGGTSAYYTSYAKVVINGTVVYELQKTYSSKTFPAARGSVSGTTGYIAHNADGTKSIAIELDGYVYSNSTKTATATMALTSIPRASTPTAAAINTGSNVSISWTPATSTFNYTLEIKVGSTTKKVEGITPGSTSKYTYTGWTVPHSAVPNATQVQASATLYTYNGTTLIGGSSTYFMVYVPASIVPSISSLTMTMVSPISSYATQISKASWGCTAAAGTGATISSYVFSFAGASGTGETGTTGYLTTSGSQVPSITVTDSRGRTATYSLAAVTVYEYSVPAINGLVVQRCDADGNYDNDGDYISIYGTVVAADIDGITPAFQYQWKTGDGTYSSLITINSGTLNVLSGFTTLNTYVINVVGSDNVGGSVNVETTVPTGEITVHLKSGGKGVAIGKYSEEDYEIEIDDDWSIVGGYYTPKVIQVSLTFSGGQASYNFGEEVMVLSVNGIATYTAPTCYSRIEGYHKWGFTMGSTNATVSVNIAYMRIKV